MDKRPVYRLDFPPLHTRPNLFYRAYTLLGELTPIHADCGQLCGGACCNGGEEEGMLLFPGEEVFLQKLYDLCPEADRDAYTVRTDGGRQLYICRGSCQRTYRPLACRIFPLFPTLETDGRIRVMTDPRAFRVCPMVQAAARLDRRFIRTVRRVGRLLTSDPACRDFLLAQTKELQALTRLIPLEKGFHPIRYR